MDATEGTAMPEVTERVASRWAPDRPIGVAVLGMGNVGSEVVRILREHADDLRARVDRKSVV